MLTVLLFAFPRFFSIVLARVGFWNESGGAVRLRRPLLSSGVISSLVDAGEISRTPSGIATDRATGIVSDEAHSPAIQLAPSSTILRAADTDESGLVSESSVRSLTLEMLAWADLAALLIWSAATFAAFSPGGPKSERVPVSGTRSPIVSCPVWPPPPPPQATSPSEAPATPIASSTSLSLLIQSPPRVCTQWSGDRPLPRAVFALVMGISLSLQGWNQVYVTSRSLGLRRLTRRTPGAG